MPPRGVNFKRVADQVREDLAHPLGIVADDEWLLRHRNRQVHATPFGRNLRLLDGRLDRRADVLRPQIELHQARIQLGEFEKVLGEPVQPLDLLGARLEEFGPRLGVLAGLLPEQLVEGSESGERSPQLVGDVGEELAAGVAVAADNLHGFLDLVGHGVELPRQLGDLLGPCSGGIGGHAACQVSFGEGSGRVREASEGLREAPRQESGNGRGEQESEGDRADEEADDRGDRAGPGRIRRGQADFQIPGRLQASWVRKGIDVGVADLVAGLTLAGRGGEIGPERGWLVGGEEYQAAGRVAPEPEPQPQIRLGHVVGVVGHRGRGTDFGGDVVVEVAARRYHRDVDRIGFGDRLGANPDHVRDGVGPGGEVQLLLLPEVAVEDHDRSGGHDAHGQGEDHDEGQ